jgi:hypothetical protein
LLNTVGSFAARAAQAANSKRMVVCPDSRGLSLRGDALLASLRSTGGEARADPAGQGCGVALPTNFEALMEAMEADVNPHRVSARARVCI